GGGGSPLDRRVVGGETGCESLLKLGNQIVEMGHGVRGKRGHSLKSNLPEASGAGFSKMNGPSRPPTGIGRLFHSGRFEASGFPGFSATRTGGFARPPAGFRRRSHGAHPPCASRGVMRCLALRCA